MTPQAAGSTREMDEGLWQRFTTEGTKSLELEPLTLKESTELTVWWLNRARENPELKVSPLIQIQWQNYLYTWKSVNVLK